MKKSLKVYFCCESKLYWHINFSYWSRIVVWNYCRFSSMLEMTHCLSLIKASVVCASTKLPEYFYVVNTATNHSGEEIIFRNRAVEYHSSMISFLAWAMQPASRAGALHLWSLDEVEHYEQDWNHLQSRMKFTASPINKCGAEWRQRWSWTL